MIRTTRTAVLGGLFACGLILSAGPAAAQTAWISQSGNASVQRVDTTTDTTQSGAIGVGNLPTGVLATSTRVYVTNAGSGTVTVLDAANGSPVATITVGAGPYGLGLPPDGTRLLVANRAANTVSVINTATNLVVGTLTAAGTPPASPSARTGRPPLSPTRAATPSPPTRSPPTPCSPPTRV